MTWLEMTIDFGSKKRRKRSLMLEEAHLNLKWKFQLVSLLWKLLGVGGGRGGGVSLCIGFDKTPIPKNPPKYRAQNATCDKSRPVVAVRTSRSEEIQHTLITSLVIMHSMCAIIQSFWGAKIVRDDPSSPPTDEDNQGLDREHNEKKEVALYTLGSLSRGTPTQHSRRITILVLQ